jgi:hypothetical protein
VANHMADLFGAVDFVSEYDSRDRDRIEEDHDPEDNMAETCP